MIELSVRSGVDSRDRVRSCYVIVTLVNWKACSALGLLTAVEQSDSRQYHHCPAFLSRGKNLFFDALRIGFVVEESRLAGREGECDASLNAGVVTTKRISTKKRDAQLCQEGAWSASISAVVPPVLGHSHLHSFKRTTWSLPSRLKAGRSKCSRGLCGRSVPRRFASIYVNQRIFRPCFRIPANPLCFRAKYEEASAINTLLDSRFSSFMVTPERYFADGYGR